MFTSGEDEAEDGRGVGEDDHRGHQSEVLGLHNAQGNLHNTQAISWNHNPLQLWAEKENI